MEIARRTIAEIIRDSGGAAAVAEATAGAVSVDAVYKWSKIGIPDRHWPVVMPLAGATPDEIFNANLHCREQQREAS